jgi:hypothetical protein
MPPYLIDADTAAWLAVQVRATLDAVLAAPQTLASEPALA